MSTKLSFLFFLKKKDENNKRANLCPDKPCKWQLTMLNFIVRNAIIKKQK